MTNRKYTSVQEAVIEVEFNLPRNTDLTPEMKDFLWAIIEERNEEIQQRQDEEKNEKALDKPMRETK